MNIQWWAQFCVVCLLAISTLLFCLTLIVCFFKTFLD